MKEFTKAELFDGVRKKVTLEELENAGVQLCEGTKKADRFWLVLWGRHIEVMGSWNGDADCIDTISEGAPAFQALRASY